MLSKFTFLKTTCLLTLAFGVMSVGQVHAQIPTLDPVTHPKFTDAQELPVPGVIDMTGGGSKTVYLRKTTQWMGLYSPGGAKLYTNVYGYGLGYAVSSPGPTIVGMRGNPFDIRWWNKLPNGHIMTVDYSLHMAQWKPRNGIPIVTHLHGGHVNEHSDGNTEAWYTRDWKEGGPWYHYFKNTYGDNKWYHYRMDQEAGTTWYHDHCLGITRLNVCAGLAGFFLQTDANEQALIASNVLPDMGYGLAVQDRMFTTSGALFMPFIGEADLEDCPVENPVTPIPFPSVVAEFFGDFIMVNGMVWPYQNVEPRKYRYRVLNGSDSRFYNFQLSNGEPFLIVGTDDALLEYPVETNSFTMGPGERYDIVIDFSGYENQNVILQNTGPDEPFKGGNFEPDVTRPTGQIMQFRVGATATVPNATVSTETQLRDHIEPLVPTNTRKVVLFEGRDQYCRLRPALGIYDPGNPLNGSLMWDEAITENPALGSTEAWEIYNTTEDAHPMHIHQVAFQIEGRYSHEGEAEIIGSDPMVGGTKAAMTDPGVVTKIEGAVKDYEKGWKDEVHVLPGQMSKVIAHYDLPGDYVWHCHILSHEDHEMMRPFYVGTIPMDIPHGSHHMGVVELLEEMQKAELEQNFPNPFGTETNILFTLPGVRDVRLELYDMNGQLVGVLADGTFPAGKHKMVWDGNGANGLPAANGIYFYKLVAGEQILTKRLTLAR
ncbi:MAG: multicopper oxidase domain-containing protein [Lewinellaceae bacterium]|nr:multicopper oxidase domain-containing protein [Lewinellaceae bacterium]